MRSQTRNCDQRLNRLGALPFAWRARPFTAPADASMLLQLPIAIRRFQHPLDAVTLIVLHHLPGTAGKASILKSMAMRLKPGAPLILVVQSQCL